MDSTPSPRATRRELAVRVAAERDPLGILERQDATRLEDLVPLRAQRMAASPFAFYRGTAAIMAADQARDPHSGILVASCGDAHVSNFGFYASPQRTLLFDLNDFDEAALAPWEWDLKRLVTSVIIGGRATDRSSSTIERAARAAVMAYASALRFSTRRSPLERYYSHYDPSITMRRLDPASRKALRAAVAEAERRTGDRAVRRLTEEGEDGRHRFVEAPPVTTHVGPEIEASIHEHFEAYRRSAYVDVRTLISQYVVDDVARRVVGVGSVGTRCYLALLRDARGGLFILQVKQAGRSVLEEHGGIAPTAELRDLVAAGGEGARVVGLQRILQAYSDPFLGHFRGETGDYYVRQFHDMKGSFEVELLEDGPFRRYAEACAAVLARAHAQSPTADEVAAYVGKGRRVADAVVAWSEAYADVSLADYQDFVAAQQD